jgi:hypothetical protein
LKAWDFAAVHYGGECYCVDCLPAGVAVDSEGVDPIFASSEVDYYPVCGVCGHEHDYMGLTTYGRQSQNENTRDSNEADF